MRAANWSGVSPLPMRCRRTWGATQLPNRFAIEFPFGNLTFGADSGRMVPHGERLRHV